MSRTEYCAVIGTHLQLLRSVACCVYTRRQLLRASDTCPKLNLFNQAINWRSLRQPVACSHYRQPVAADRRSSPQPVGATNYDDISATTISATDEIGHRPRRPQPIPYRPQAKSISATDNFNVGQGCLHPCAQANSAFHPSVVGKSRTGLYWPG